MGIILVCGPVPNGLILAYGLCSQVSHLSFLTFNFFCVHTLVWNSQRTISQQPICKNVYTLISGYIWCNEFVSLALKYDWDQLYPPHSVWIFLLLLFLAWNHFLRVHLFSSESHNPENEIIFQGNCINTGKIWPDKKGLSRGKKMYSSVFDPQIMVIASTQNDSVCSLQSGEFHLVLFILSSGSTLWDNPDKHTRISAQ